MRTYQDKQIQADAGLFRSLFPEQTKTIPRILVWSSILLLDLILGVLGAVHFGLLDFGRYSSQNTMSLVTGCLVAAILAVFWLQGKIWYGVIGYLQKRNMTD